MRSENRVKLEIEIENKQNKPRKKAWLSKFSVPTINAKHLKIIKHVSFRQYIYVTCSFNSRKYVTLIQIYFFRENKTQINIIRRTKQLEKTIKLKFQDYVSGFIPIRMIIKSFFRIQWRWSFQFWYHIFIMKASCKISQLK